MSIASYALNRSMAFVSRWHARKTTLVDNLATHHYFVVRNARLVCRALYKYGIAKPDEKLVMDVALVHDEVEEETGDITGRAKRLYPQFRDAVHRIEQQVIPQMYQELPEPLDKEYADLALFHTFNPECLEQQIVRYADKLDAYNFVFHEVAVGNTLMAPVLEEIRRELEQFKWPWLQTLRAETGLP